MPPPVSQIDPEHLEQLRQAGSVALLDVRTDPEVARGLIAGSKQIRKSCLWCTASLGPVLRRPVPGWQTAGSSKSTTCKAVYWPGPVPACP